MTMTIGAELLLLARQVAELEAERNELARRVAVLDTKLIEISDLAHERELIRRTYRRGYHAGYAAGRASAVELSNPERRARTWVREALGR